MKTQTKRAYRYSAVAGVYHGQVLGDPGETIELLNHMTGTVLMQHEVPMARDWAKLHLAKVEGIAEVAIPESREDMQKLAEKLDIDHRAVLVMGPIAGWKPRGGQ